MAKSLDDLRGIFAHELHSRGCVALSCMVKDGVDNSLAGRAAIAAMERLNHDAAEDERHIDEVTAIAVSPGNSGANEYMRGMANGLILAQSIIKGNEPEYIDAPPNVEPSYVPESFGAGRAAPKQRTAAEVMEDIGRAARKAYEDAGYLAHWDHLTAKERDMWRAKVATAVINSYSAAPLSNADERIVDDVDPASRPSPVSIARAALEGKPCPCTERTIGKASALAAPYGHGTSYVDEADVASFWARHGATVSSLDDPRIPASLRVQMDAHDEDALDREPQSRDARLDAKAFGEALDAATESHIAGDEEQEQLAAGIQAYIDAAGPHRTLIINLDRSHGVVSERVGDIWHTRITTAAERAAMEAE